jgi:hypothetical protein
MITIATVSNTKVFTLKRSPSKSAIAVASMTHGQHDCPLALQKSLLESRLPPGFFFVAATRENLQVLQNIAQCGFADTALPGGSAAPKSV